MKMNREHVRKEFDRYAKQYNLDDPKIRLKYAHTYRVARLCDIIAHSLNLSEDDCDLAWILGMFHDIGRFEQVRRYHTFQDKESVNHAELSADLLFREYLSASFLEADAKELDLMEKAVRWHNRYHLPVERTRRETLFANILRDADKIDILRVNCETPREDIYNLPTEAFTDSSMSDEVYENMLKKQPVDRKFSKTGVDFIMGHIAFIFDLNFDVSKQIIADQGYLDQLLSFQSNNEETVKRINMVRTIVRHDLEESLNRHPVYFTRHGQTTWNVADKICGTTDVELTDHGIEQAKELGRKIKEEQLPIDKILYSPLIRAAETARYISEMSGIPAEVEPRLKEQNFGKWEGTSPRNSAGFTRDKERFISGYDGGESMLRMSQRIYNLLDELKEDREHTYLLVAHNGISRFIHSYFNDMENEEFAAFGIKNCEIRKYEF